MASTFGSGTTGGATVTDRYIADRQCLDKTIDKFNQISQDIPDDSYSKALAAQLFDDSRPQRVLTFQTKHHPYAVPGSSPPRQGRRISTPHAEHPGVSFGSGSAVTLQQRKTVRRLPNSAEKVLDAPEIRDDLSLNLLDWSSLNYITIGLGPAVYLWKADTTAINTLTTYTAETAPTSVSFSPNGLNLCICRDPNVLEIYDLATMQCTTKASHKEQVNAAAWSSDTVIASGGKDSRIIVTDIRMKSIVRMYIGHKQGVCGLKFNCDGSLLCSGGSDGLVCVWDLTSPRPRATFREHKGAVKALGWSPTQRHVLASGGGSGDGTVRLWNVSQTECVHRVETNSQVCSLLWSTNSRELLTSHGYENNNISVWTLPSITKVGDMNGHKERVLFTALSPDGTTLASAGADETLRFWKVFDERRKKSKSSTSQNSVLTIR